MKKLLAIILITLSLIACGGGGSDSEESVKVVSNTPVHVIVMGDSITAQSGMRVRDHLQKAKPGSTMENLGYNARRAKEMLEGTYGSLPVLNKNFFYVVSFGTNEYLQGRSVEEYIKSIEDILIYFKGYNVILEAPWLVVNKGCSCNNINDFRDQLKILGAKYNVPVLLENSLENTDTIHLTGPHMDERAALVAKTILEKY